MTFAELLKAREAAAAHNEECAASELSAAELHEQATADYVASTEAVVAADKAIHDRLVEKGHHTLSAADGTISVYAANDETTTGWSAYHPIPGESA